MREVPPPRDSGPGHPGPGHPGPGHPDPGHPGPGHPGPGHPDPGHSGHPGGPSGPGFLLFLSTAGALYFATILLVNLFQGNTEIFRPGGRAIGADFAIHWAGAHAAVTGQADALTGRFSDYLRGLFPAHPVDLVFWNYPPVMLLFTAPFGLLPYALALLAWSVTGLALLGLVTWRFSRSGWIVLAVLVSPAVFLNVWIGQTGSLLAAILLGGLALAERRPFLAGVVWGLLITKPVFALQLPFLLLPQRRFAVIAGGLSCVAVLVLLSVAIFGTGPWLSFFGEQAARGMENLREGGGNFLLYLFSTAGFLRKSGVDGTLAIRLHFLVAGLVAIHFALCAFRNRTLPSPVVLATVTMLISPYALVYDLPILCLAVALQLASRRDMRLRPGEPTLYALAWLLPILNYAGDVVEALPIAPALSWLCLVLVYLAGTRAWDRERTAGPPQGVSP